MDWVVFWSGNVQKMNTVCLKWYNSSNRRVRDRFPLEKKNI